MTPDMVRLSVLDATARPGTCELCATDGEPLGGVVLVQHARGGEARFAVCGRCLMAVQRVAAAVGSQGQFREVRVPVATPAADEPRAPSPAGPPVVSGPELLLTSAHVMQRPDGATYAIRVLGQARADGTWIGWLEFAGPDGVLRTGRETTQSNRDGVLYWATGLEPAYFQGAFERAR
jgi:hypothetical protein